MNATRRSCRVYKNHQLKFKIQITFNNYSFFIIFLKKFTRVSPKSIIKHIHSGARNIKALTAGQHGGNFVDYSSHTDDSGQLIIEKNLHLLYQNYLTYTALLNVPITNMQKNNKNSKIPETKQPNASNELD